MAHSNAAAVNRGAKAAARKAARRRTPAPRVWRRNFIARLGETSNVTAAAEHAGISLSHVYKTRREDPEFARAWYDALAEGYDNLEMELLHHLRSGGEDGESGEGAADISGPKSQGRAAAKKFDAATAFRCLAAHRESVAREKGRRTLAGEVATIAALDAKIDRLRLNGVAATRAIAAARKSNRQRTRRAEDTAGEAALPPTAGEATRESRHAG